MGFNPASSETQSPITPLIRYASTAHRPEMRTIVPVIMEIEDRRRLFRNGQDMAIECLHAGRVQDADLFLISNLSISAAVFTSIEC